MVGRSASRPRAIRQFAASRGVNCGRTGVPVVVTRPARKRDAACGKPTKAWSTQRASQRLARPGMVLDSCRKVFAPSERAARTGGAAVKPPIASTACGGLVLKSFLAARHEFQNPRANEK